MSPRKYLAALAVGMITDSWAAQRTILKALQACPNVKDFTDWFEAMEKGDASRAVDIIDGKGCVEVNKGEMVEFERFGKSIRRLYSPDWAAAVFLDIAVRNFTTTAKTLIGVPLGVWAMTVMAVHPPSRRRDQSGARRIRHLYAANVADLECIRYEAAARSAGRPPLRVRTHSGHGLCSKSPDGPKSLISWRARRDSNS